MNPALVKHAAERAENAQNLLAARITAFSGSTLFVYIHILWFGCWIGFGVEKYPYGLRMILARGDLPQRREATVEKVQAKLHELRERFRHLVHH